MSSLKYWVWLSSLKGVGAVTIAALLQHFGTPEDVFSAHAVDFKEVNGLRQSEISLLTQKNLDLANNIINGCAKIGCRVLTFQDAEYPDRLRSIYDPPIILYVRGNLPLIDEEPAVSIVGTRNCTPYGIKAAQGIALKLSQSGIIVVTGLAKGVDTAAARGALCGGGRVIGVIGSGLDVVYPHENAELFEDVVGSGAILSEYPPGSAPLPVHFPARNRIISGISLGVAVIEAPKRSGALITAARALEQGRDVFALPGNVDAKSCEGSNSLLREGAIPILSGDDIISEYSDLFPDRISHTIVRRDQPLRDRFSPDLAEIAKHDPKHDNVKQDEIDVDNESAVEYIDLCDILNSLTGDERIIAETIGVKTMQVDDIIVKSNLQAHQVLTALTMLEVKGYALRDGAMYTLITSIQ